MLILTAGSALGTDVACTNATAFPVQPAALEVPGAGTGGLNDPSGGFDPGCTSVNLSFSLFTQTACTGCEGGDPGLGGTYATFTTPSATLVGIQLATTRPGDTANNWSITTNGNATLSTAYTFAITSSTLMSAAALRVNVGDIQGTAGNDQFVVTLNVCPGTTTFTGGCANLATATLTLTNANTNAGDTLSIVFGSVGTFQYGVQLLISGQITGNDDIFLNWVEADFGTPEPSSYLLIGTGLAFLGLLRRRRRKTSKAA